MSDQSEMDLDALADSVQTRQDFARYVRTLRDDLARNPDEWENNTLPRFLDAMAAWVSDLDGLSQNQETAVPPGATWQLFAQLLLAAQVYE